MSSARHRPVVLLAVLSFAVGCVTYVASNLELRTMLAAGEYQQALARIDRHPGGNDHLLELLQSGLVLHYAGRYDESNVVFQKAEDLAASLYTRSVSQAAASLIINDTTIAYRGQPFELAMVPYYRAFNYLSLGDPEAAQVEARKATLALAAAVERTMAEIELPQDREVAGTLENNGFLHWFSGMLFESEGAMGDAFVAYRNAARAYQAGRKLTGVAPPTALGRDLQRVGRAYGAEAEIDELRATIPEMFSGGATSTVNGPSGEVVFVIEQGWVAPRDQNVLNIPILTTDRHFSSNDDLARNMINRASPGWHTSVKVEYWLTVAVPVMAPPVTGDVVAARIDSGGFVASTVPVDDLSRRAVATFDAERGQMLFKTFLRALAKYGASRVAEKQDQTAGAIVNLLGVLTERADTRCWLTLPNRLAMARLRLPVGVHEIRIDYLDAAGRVVVSETETIDVTDNGWVFLNRRSF